MRKAYPALLKAVARARRWFEEITSGRVRSSAQIERLRMGREPFCAHTLTREGDGAMKELFRRDQFRVTRPIQFTGGLTKVKDALRLME